MMRLGPFTNGVTYELVMHTLRGYVVGPASPSVFVTAQTRPRPSVTPLP